MSSTYSFIRGKGLRRALRRIGFSTICAVAFFVMLLSGCKRHEHSEHTGDYPSAIEQLAVRHKKPDPLIESQTRGRQVYEHYCQICHGPEAQGNGFNAAMLDPPPRNFADEAFWKQTNDEHLQKVISQGGKAGGKSKLMPPWGRTLDEQQIRDVVAFLRTVPDLARQAEKADEGEEHGASG